MPPRGAGRAADGWAASAALTISWNSPVLNPLSTHHLDAEPGAEVDQRHGDGGAALDGRPEPALHPGVVPDEQRRAEEHPCEVVSILVPGAWLPTWVTTASASMAGTVMADSQYVQPISHPVRAPWVSCVLAPVG